MGDPEQGTTHIDFADRSGHQWRVQLDRSDPPEVLGISCVRCGGTPEDCATGAPGEYLPCPQGYL